MTDLSQNRKFVRYSSLPTVFCDGCGGGTVLNCFTRAVEEMKIERDHICAVTGIGCSSWILSPYFLADTIHTTHGRAISFATGVKVVRPDLKVVIVAGDGDIIGIGGNHLIHAARRNIDLTVILVNNSIYGMTGGQAAPSTGNWLKTSTTPYGNPEPSFSPADLVKTAGGTFVARWTTAHVFQLIESIKTAISHNGFSFIEIISQCTTSYGKAIGLKTGGEFLDLYKKNSIDVNQAKNYSEEELKGKFVVGTLVNYSKPEFTQSLEKIRKIACENEPKVKEN